MGARFESSNIARVEIASPPFQGEGVANSVVIGLQGRGGSPSYRRKRRASLTLFLLSVEEGS